MTSTLKFRILCALSFVFMLSCAPGDHPDFSNEDNGKDPLEAAEVSVEASPKGLQRGDRTLITIRLQEIDENGVLVKIRFSHSLQYVPNSDVFSADDFIEEVDPEEGPNLNQRRYFLLYYFPRERFGDNDYGELTFQLVAVDDADQPFVQVDTALHDPTKDPADEFDSVKPQFGVESEVRLEIDK